jgi:hypothetical protein
MHLEIRFEVLMIDYEPILPLIISASEPLGVSTHQRLGLEWRVAVNWSYHSQYTYEITLEFPFSVL